MHRHTQDELADFHAKQNWGALWSAAIPWVQLAVSSFKLADRDKEDASQETLLQIGELLPKWDPLRGPFSQFVFNRARYEVSDYLRRSRGRSQKNKEKFRPATELAPVIETAEGEDYSHEPGYMDTDTIPQGFGDPVAELTRLGAPAAAEVFLRRLEPSLALLFRARWGLPVLDEEPDETSVKDLAKAANRPRETLNNWIRDAKKFLAESVLPKHNQVTGSIYPPKGMDPWPQAPKDSGFWVGRAEAMNDVNLWRDSVSGVHSDWSWKPTDADVMRGCKR